MQSAYSNQNLEIEPHVHLGHFFTVMSVAVLLLGISWMKDPGLFRTKKSLPIAANEQDVPHYYAYVTPSEDLPGPQVAGANTQGQGPSIINEDGSVTRIDLGQVLGASTENTLLPLDKIFVKEVPDSEPAIRQYFTAAQNIESGFINNANFESALSSGNQEQINKQAEIISKIKDNLLNLSVPSSLVKLHKLKIAQYQASVGLLNNFTQADSKPELVGQYLEQFLKSQQDLDTEQSVVNQKYNLPDYLGADLSAAGSLESANQINSSQHVR